HTHPLPLHDALPICLRRTEVRHRKPLELAVLREDVDGAPVAETRHREARDLLERAAEVDESREGSARLEQKARRRFGDLPLGDVLGDSAHALEIPRIVEDREGAVPDPTDGAILPHDPVLDRRRLAAILALDRILNLGTIVVVDRVEEDIATRVELLA